MPDRSTLGSGKVRELYDAGDDRLLLVASDRISAFDVVLPTRDPRQGPRADGDLGFWFERTRHIVPNHLLSPDVDDLPDDAAGDDRRGRSMLVQRLDMLPVEVVVRGYLAGSGWPDYEATGAISGVALPRGPAPAERLPEPIVTPAFKATTRARREHHGRAGARALRRAFDHAAAAALARLRACGRARAGRAGSSWPTRSSSSGSTPGAARARRRGADARLVALLARSVHAPGQPAELRQAVRARLARCSSRGRRTAPGPELPREVVEGTAARYREAYEQLAGRPFSAYLEEQGVECA